MMTSERLKQIIGFRELAANMPWWVDELIAECKQKSRITLEILQKQQKSWVAHNFPDRLDYYPLLGAMEELGELSHAHLKTLQGIRGTALEHYDKKCDAIGDIIIYLADYCTANDICMQSALEQTWDHVQGRDWQKKCSACKGVFGIMGPGGCYCDQEENKDESKAT